MKKKYIISIILVSLITGINVQALGVHYQSYVTSPNSITKVTKVKYDFTINRASFKESTKLDAVLYYNNRSLVQKEWGTPTTPNLSWKRKTDTTIDFTWTAASDDVGITGYKVYKDGVLEATLGNTLSYKVTGLTIGTEYSFTITAFNEAGNESTPSNVITSKTGSH